MDSEQQNQVLVTPNNRGPLINLATWLTLVVMCLATFTKIGSKLRKIGRLQGDDFLMFAAMVSWCPILLPEKAHADQCDFDIITGPRNRSDRCRCQSSHSWPRPTYQLLDYIPDRPISKSEFSPLHWHLKSGIESYLNVSSRAMLLNCCIYYHSAWPNSLFYFFSLPLPSAPSVGL